MISQAEQDVRTRQERREFVNWLSRQTYNEAERHYRQGTLSEDGWTCYRVIWALSAPRFSSLADFGRNLAHQACMEGGAS